MFHITYLLTFLHLLVNRATLKAGMTEWQNDGITEGQKMTSKPNRNPDFLPFCHSMILSFRISGDFPSFRLLGFWEIFCHSIFISGDFSSFSLLGYRGILHCSVIPSFRNWSHFLLFRCSLIPSFMIWGHFLLFHRSLIPGFRVALISRLQS